MTHEESIGSYKNDKIQVIKLLRSIGAYGLVESKDFADLAISWKNEFGGIEGANDLLTIALRIHYMLVTNKWKIVEGDLVRVYERIPVFKTADGELIIRKITGFIKIYEENENFFMDYDEPITNENFFNRY